MTGQLEVRFQSLGGCLIVRVAGELDTVGARVLRDQLVGQVSAGETRLVVDLSRVVGLDVAGLCALLAAHQEVEASRGSLRLVGVNPSARKVVRATEQASVLTIDDDMSDALEATMEAASASVRGRRHQPPRKERATDQASTMREVKRR